MENLTLFFGFSKLRFCWSSIILYYIIYTNQWNRYPIQQRDGLILTSAIWNAYNILALVCIHISYAIPSLIYTIYQCQFNIWKLLWTNARHQVNQNIVIDGWNTVVQYWVVFQWAQTQLTTSSSKSILRLSLTTLSDIVYSYLNKCQNECDQRFK